MLLGLGGRQMSHPALPLGAGGMLGSPPGQQALQGNGSAHGGSYHGGSYGGQSASGSYHGGQSASGSYHGGHASGSYHGGQSAGGSYHAGQAGGSYHGGQLGGGSYHSGQQQFGGDGSFHGSQGGSSYGAAGLGAMGQFGASTGVNLGLLQAQAAALQQQLSGGAGLGLEGSSPSQLISLLSASSAAASQAVPLARYASAGQTVGSAASSQGDLSSLLGAAAAESSVHGGWLRGTLPGGGGLPSSSSGSLGPASARAGGRAPAVVLAVQCPLGLVPIMSRCPCSALPSRPCSRTGSLPLTPSACVFPARPLQAPASLWASCPRTRARRT